MILDFVDAVFVYQLNESDAIQWHSRVHSHERGQYEVHYFLEGAARFKNKDTVYMIKPGAFFVTRPEQVHSIRVEKQDKPLTYYALLFTINEHDAELADFLTNEVASKTNYNIGTKYRFFFEEVMKKSASQEKNLRVSAAYQFLSFLYTLAVEGNNLKYTVEGNIHIERSLKILQDNIFDDITIGEVAKKLNLTEEYFIRLFKQKMNTTPKKYYIKLKIEAANSMLISTDLPMRTIARRLYFYNEFHFSRTFKQYAGISPSLYRKEFKAHYKNQTDPVLIKMFLAKHLEGKEKKKGLLLEKK